MIRCLVTCACTLIIQFTEAQVSLPDIFTENMVLQRNAPIHFWGKGNPNTKVEIKFLNKTRETTVSGDSTWNIYFEKKKATKVAQKLQISHGLEKIVLQNILIGDVWLCLGQSNMEWPMENEIYFNEEMKNSDLPKLRFFNPTYSGKNLFGKSFNDSIMERLNEENFYNGRWEYSSEKSIRTMSAVGYYFGKHVMESEKVPIGVINLSIGGAPIETFISPDIFRRLPSFKSKVQGNWLTNESLPIWVRERGYQNVGDSIGVVNDNMGPNHAFKPGFAFTSGILPILPMPIKGIIWYQGESNSARGHAYREVFPLMIETWRRDWKQGDFSFYWVQLADFMGEDEDPKDDNWPELREAQTMTLDKLPNVGQAVIIDVGEGRDIHPRNKHDVGNRLARWALARHYQKKGMVYSGPLYKAMKVEGGRIRLAFAHSDGLKSRDGQDLNEFKIAGSDGQFVDAKAKIEGKFVLVSAESIKSPTQVRFGWHKVANPNLVNKALLPASPFQTNNWSGGTAEVFVSSDPAKASSGKTTTGSKKK